MPSERTLIAELTAVELLDLMMDREELRSLTALHRKVDQLVADVQALNDAVAALEASEQAAVQELSDLAGEVAALQAGTITQEQIDSLTGRVTNVATALKTATDAGAATDAGEPPPAAAPGEPPAEPPPADAGGSGAPPA